MNLFNEYIGKPVRLKATQTAVWVKSFSWHNNQLDFDCIVPQIDEKGKITWCNATYSQNEIEFTS
jgi:hypothetical protein